MTNVWIVVLTEMLLDDFLLTYLVFMTTSDLCQALLGQYPYWQKQTVTRPSLKLPDFTAAKLL